MPTITDDFIRDTYPGLNEGEDELIRKYIRKQQPDIEKLETNVPLGPGELRDDFVLEGLRKSWQRASQLKADVLVHTRTELFLVELKDHIRTSALGQLQCYEFWLSRQRDIERPIVRQAVAEVINPSAIGPYKAKNVEIIPIGDRAEKMVRQGEKALREGFEDLQS